MWIKDPKCGRPSATLTVFITTAVIAMLKLLLSGVVIGSFAVPVFDGTEFATVLGAAGAIYAARKHTDKDK